jgi:hypothetical protein
LVSSSETISQAVLGFLKLNVTPNIATIDCSFYESFVFLIYGVDFETSSESDSIFASEKSNVILDFVCFYKFEKVLPLNLKEA